MDYTVTKEDLPQLRQMYQTVFHETGRTTDLFFDHMVTIENTFAVFEKGLLVSMAFGVVREFKFFGAASKAVYICGVATKENARGKGYSKAIMGHMEERYAKDGIDFLYLVPANDGLYSMYEKYGYQTAFYLNRQETPIEAGAAAEPIKTEISDLLSGYHKMADGFNIFQLRKESDFAFLLKEVSYNGGCLSYGEAGYILYYISDNKAYVRETTIQDADLFRGSLRYLKREFGAQRAVVTRPAQKDGSDMAYAMVLPLHLGREAFLDDISKNFANLNYD